MTSTEHPTPPHAPFVLGVGVMAISAAAVLIRLAESGPLATAFWRMTFSTVLLGALSLPRWKTTEVPWKPTLAAGVALGLHFWTWMISIEKTSVASSTLFVTTTPVWVALAAPFLPDESALSKKGWIGLTVALAGGITVALATARGDHSQVTAEGLAWALVGAWCMATYLAFSRRARKTMDLFPFATLANATAALTLGVVAIASGAELSGYDRQTWLVFAAMAAIPQLIGHNSLLWALRFVGAAVVSVVVLLEPVGAAVLGALVLNEFPTLHEIAGGALLLLGLGILVGVRSAPSRRAD